LIRATGRQYGQSTARARRFHQLELSSPPQSSSSHSKPSFNDLSPIVRPNEQDNSDHQDSSHDDQPGKTKDLEENGEQESDKEISDSDSESDSDDSEKRVTSKRKASTSSNYLEVDSDVSESRESDSDSDELGIAQYSKITKKVSKKRQRLSESSNRPRKIAKGNVIKGKGKGKRKEKVKSIIEIGSVSGDESDKEDSDQEDDSPMLGAGRGSINESRKSLDNKSDDENEIMEDREEATVEKPTEVKKGRRPRKSETSISIPLDSDSASPKPERKRGRGRPRKSETSISDKQPFEHSFTLRVTPPPKKKIKSAAQLKWDELSLSEKKRQLGIASSEDEEERNRNLVSPKRRKEDLKEGNNNVKSPPLIGSKKSTALGSLVRIDSREIPIQDASPDPSPVLDPQHRSIALASNSQSRQNSNPNSSSSSNRSIPLPSAVKARSNLGTPANGNGGIGFGSSNGGKIKTKTPKDYILSSKPLPAGDYYSRKKKEEDSPTGKTVAARKSLGIESSGSKTQTGTGISQHQNKTPQNSSPSTPKVVSNSSNGFKKSTLSNQVASSSSNSTSTSISKDPSKVSSVSKPSGKIFSTSLNNQTSHSTGTSSAITATVKAPQIPMSRQIPHVKGTKKPDMRSLIGKGGKPKSVVDSKAGGMKGKAGVKKK